MSLLFFAVQLRSPFLKMLFLDFSAQTKRAFKEYFSQ